MDFLKLLIVRGSCAMNQASGWLARGPGFDSCDVQMFFLPARSSKGERKQVVAPGLARGLRHGF